MSLTVNQSVREERRFDPYRHSQTKLWGMGLQGVVTCFAIKKSDRFDSDILHQITEV